MASWNGSCPEDKSFDSYDYIAPGYVDYNMPSYSSNWAFYPVPSVPMQQAHGDGLNQFNTSGFTDQLHQANFSTPTAAQYIDLRQHANDGNEPSSDTIFSSLAPNAGEFIPRQNVVPSYEVNDTSSSVMFRDTEQKYNFKRGGRSTGHNQFPRQKTEVYFNRRKNNARGTSDNNNTVISDASDMEKMKTKDRERLLVEAAAFLTPTNSVESKPPPNVNSESEKKLQNTDIEQNTNSSRWNSNTNTYYKSPKNQQFNPNLKKKKVYSSYQSNMSGSQHQRNADHPSEAYGNWNEKRSNYQSKFSNFNNGRTTYRKFDSVQDFSPKKSSHGDHEVQDFSPKKNSQADHQVKEKEDDSNQRERLAEQLSRGILECLVCCERVRQHDPVWSCSNCYHVFHLKCIKKWAKSSKAEIGWQCPACRNTSAKVPYDYYCFCGKVRDPEWNRVDTPHSCGQMCGLYRPNRQPDCMHRCTLLCHPGPCPNCTAQVTRSCGCGKKSQTVKCGSDQIILCGAECGKVLNCSIHYCKNLCHGGNCSECKETITQVCYCEKVTKEVPCTQSFLNQKNFSCGDKCDRVLTCGNHKCSLTCHSGPCSECELTPDKVTHCPCGQTPLSSEQLRNSCLDPVPTCDMKCNKILSCGPEGNPHVCQSLCHSGPCPDCPLITNMKCRCGNMYLEISCKDLKSMNDSPTCEKKCAKKRLCGKHKCNQLCCIDQEHACPLPCNHQLSCGQHRCEERCHRGRCPPCWRMSFEELYCECGASVSYPPIPCGTRRPECSKPCSRPHPCDHPALHNCHSQPTCPPCTVLTQKYCYGKHELRKSIPCHQEEFSCGLPCNLELSCGRHHCILPCHKGPCFKEGQFCTQPCTTPRSLCGHNCTAPCHEGPCPDIPCKEMVKVTCECGHRSSSRTCCDNVKEYQRIATSLLASKMADMQLGHSVDIGDILQSPSARKMSLKTLECNEECRLIERNRRLAIGLQIRNPDLSAKLTPRYSEFMRQWAKKDPHFCNMVHEKLTELVQLAKQSKQKSRSYSFDYMNRDKRHFVHEYCEHFGCDSVAYDPEPKRNVVATAIKDKSWLPSMSLLEVIRRENGQRKIPKPVINTNHTQLERAVNVLPVKCSQTQSSTVAEKTAGPVPSAKACQADEEIDYFDFT